MDDMNQRQNVTVTHKMLDGGSGVTSRDAVPLNDTVLQMRRGDNQLIRFPLPGREALPGVWRFSRGMWPAIHPDRAILRLPVQVNLPCNIFLRSRIDHTGDSQIRIRSNDAQRYALPFRVCADCSVPMLGEGSSGII